MAERSHLEGFGFVQVLLRWPDQVTVVAALLQLHHDVQETRRAPFDTFTQSFVVPGQDPSESRQKSRAESGLKVVEVSAVYWSERGSYL